MSAYGNVVRWLLEGNPAFMVRADGAEQGWRIRCTVLAEEGAYPSWTTQRGPPVRPDRAALNGAWLL